MATKFVAAPAPALPYQPHAFDTVWLDGRAGCRHCPLPRRNRVHHEETVRAAEADRRARLAEWAAHDAARLGER